MKVTVWSREELPVARALLTIDELSDLDRLGLVGDRADEWIAGRLAMHQVLGTDASVLTHEDGAPNYVSTCGAVYRSVSLSHDGPWVAVAAAEVERVAIDLCCAEHVPRVARILDRLGVRRSGERREIVAGGGTVLRDMDPCVAWAALECALKLRRRGVWSLLDASLAISADGRVSGIGDDVQVEWSANERYALAWAQEAA